MPFHITRHRALHNTGLMSFLVVAMLLSGCASGPADDTADVGPPSVAPPPAATAPATSGAAGISLGSADAASVSDEANLTPADRQARARQAAAQADRSAQQALQQQCSSLRSDIRAAHLSEQQAPSTSVSEPIVQAKEAHADQRIQRLQEQYDALNCDSIVGPQSHAPVMPLPSAPNGLTPPGAQGGSPVP